MAFAPVILTTGLFLTVTAPVGNEGHPVAVSVNVNVAEPTDTPVTRPALFTVATAELLLAHVPPVFGDNCVVKPAQIEFEPTILTVGLGVIVIVMSLVQPEAVSVNLTSLVPAVTPVTTLPTNVKDPVPPATSDHVPPVEGNNVAVDPIQIFVELALTVGLGLTVIAPVVFEQPVAVNVNVNVVLPCDTPVTTPPFVMVAMAGFVLAQVPPLVGDKVVVLPTQIVGGDAVTVGFATTVNADVGSDTQPVAVSVHVKVTDPGVRPVINPALLIVATAGLLLAHVPPELGVTVVDPSTQILLNTGLVTVGLAVTVTVNGSDAHPVTVSVNVNCTVPAATPSTRPALDTVATEALLVAHVPPVVGVNVVVPPIHMVDVPVMATVGLGFTVTGAVVLVHPVVVLVNVKVALPCPTADTTPPLVTVATALLLLVHVPPEDGESVVVDPIQMEFEPTILTVGLGFTTICIVSEQLVVEYINR
jgi:hypothetical protein